MSLSLNLFHNLANTWQSSWRRGRRRLETSLRKSIRDMRASKDCRNLRSFHLKSDTELLQWSLWAPPVENHRITRHVARFQGLLQRCCKVIVGLLLLSPPLCLSSPLSHFNLKWILVGLEFHAVSSWVKMYSTSHGWHWHKGHLQVMQIQHYCTWAGWFFAVGGGGWPVRCRVLSSILGFCPPDASNHPPLCVPQSKICPSTLLKFPGGAVPSSWELFEL